MTTTETAAAQDGARGALANMDRVTQAIAGATKLDELREYDRQLAAFRQYAKSQRLPIAEQNSIMAARLRCQRKAGECLYGIEREDGGRPRKNSHQPGTRFVAAINEAGISASTAYRWQRFSFVPETIFEGWLTSVAERGEELTAAGLEELAGHYCKARPKVKQPLTLVKTAAEVSQKRTADEEQQAKLRRALELPDGERGHVVQLLLSTTEMVDLGTQVAFLKRVYATRNVTDTVREAVKHEYRRMTQPHTGSVQ